MNGATSPLPPAWLPAELPTWTSLTLRDGYQTPVVVHSPPEDAPAALPVVYLHGIQSHPGWFYRSARALADAGHRVYQPTRRGSGANTAQRGHADSAEQLIEDLAATIDHAKRDADAPACHLLGVSWGGKLAMAYAAQRGGKELATLTLLAPGLCPQVDVGLGTKLAIGLSLLCCPRRAFAIPLSAPELFTDNPAMREYLRDDAGRLHTATARFLYVSRCLDRRIARVERGSVTTPTTLLLASRDRIIDNAATRRLCGRVCGSTLTVEEFDGAHTLEFQTEPDAFLAALPRSLATASKLDEKG